MTLLRRAPRQVYRLYDEEEFLVSAAHESPCEAAFPAAAARPLARLVGPTMLLGLAGAVGGLIALVGIAAAPGTRRRSDGGLLASTRPVRARSLGPAVQPRSRSWRRSSPVARSRAAAARRRPRRVARRGAPAPRSAPASHALAPRAGAQVVAAALGEPRTAPVQPQSGHGSAATMITVSQPRGSGRSEFGFER